MTKAELYDDLARQLAALIDGEPDRTANAANMAALIYHGLPALNWAGFYLEKGGELVLGRSRQARLRPHRLGQRRLRSRRRSC